MRGDQLARQWRIIRTLEANKHGLTVAELAEAEEVGVRTIYRDLDALHEAGFPIYSEKADRVNKWFFVDTYVFKVPPPFSLTELMSLWIYKDLLKVFENTAFFDSLESLFKKIRATLPPQTMAYLEKIQSVFSVGIKPYKKYGAFREIINQVNQAALDKNIIEIAYTPLRSSEETLRRVDPYKIWFLDGTLYLIAYCHLREEVRVFVLDRMKLVSVTNHNFEVMDDFDFDQYIRHSFKVIRDDIRKVKVRVSRQWARWASEKVWHESQKCSFQEDGSVIFTFQVAGLKEIKMWVMSLGEEAEVLAPQELIREITENLNRTLDQYSAPPSSGASPSNPERSKAHGKE